MPLIWSPPCWKRWASSRRSRFAAWPSRPSRALALPIPLIMPRCPASTTPSILRCLPTGPSTTMAGGRCAASPAPAMLKGPRKGRSLGDEITPEVLDDLDANGWELYHIAEDPTESHNLAEQHPEKLREMIARWYVEAGKYQVMPLDGTLFQRLVAERPRLTKVRNQYTFYPDLSVVPRQYTAGVKPAAQHHRRGRYPDRWRGRCAHWRRAALPAVMCSMSRITNCTTCTTIWAWRSSR